MTEPSCHLDSEKAAMDEKIMQVYLHGEYKSSLEAWACIFMYRIE